MCVSLGVYMCIMCVEKPTEMPDLLGFIPMGHLFSVTSVSLLVGSGEQIVSYTITTSSVHSPGFRRLSRIPGPRSYPRSHPSGRDDPGREKL